MEQEVWGSQTICVVCVPQPELELQQAMVPHAQQWQKHFGGASWDLASRLEASCFHIILVRLSSFVAPHAVTMGQAA